MIREVSNVSVAKIVVAIVKLCASSFGTHEQTDLNHSSVRFSPKYATGDGVG